jgi:hypothetical protein
LGEGGQMVRDWKTWTLAVAGGKEEPANAEGFMREVLLFAQHMPGVTLRVAEGFLREVLDEAEKRAGEGDPLALSFFEALEKVELRASREGRLAEKYQVVLEEKGGNLDLRRVMKDVVLLARENPGAILYAPKGVLDRAAEEALAMARIGDLLGFKFLGALDELVLKPFEDEALPEWPELTGA